MRVEQNFDEKMQPLGTKPPSFHGSTKSTLNDATEKPVALPLCASCAAATPKMSSMFLNNERVQSHLVALKEIIDGVDLVSYKPTPADAHPTLGRTSTKDDQGRVSGDTARGVGNDEHLDASPCVLCTTKKALPAVASLLLAMKAVWKEQTATMSKAEKKALKSEVKAQARDVKKEFKKAKKLTKKERKSLEQ